MRNICIGGVAKSWYFGPNFYLQGPWSSVDLSWTIPCCLGKKWRGQVCYQKGCDSFSGREQSIHKQRKILNFPATAPYLFQVIKSWQEGWSVASVALFLCQFFFFQQVLVLSVQIRSNSESNGHSGMNWKGGPMTKKNGKNQTKRRRIKHTLNEGKHLLEKYSLE